MTRQILIGGCLAFLFSTACLHGNDLPVDSLVHQISDRQEELYLRIDDWKARVISRTSWLDRSWNPTRSRIVEKNFRIQELEQQEEILHAEEWKDSTATDITEDMIKAQNRFNFRRKFEDLLFEELSSHGDSLSADEMFPFSKEHRPIYNYSVAGDTAMDGRSVRIVEFRCQTPDPEYFNGRVYADRENHNIYKAVFWPSDNPMFVRKLLVEFSFFVHPNGFYGPKRLDIILGAELLFVNLLRRQWVEEYSEYSVLNAGGNSGR